MDRPRPAIVDSLIGLALGLLSFSAYYWSMAVGAFPGDFSAVLVQSSGLFPKLSPDHPLWNGVAAILTKLSGRDISAPFNLFSALCGGACAGLLYLIVSDLIYAFIRVEEENAARARAAARIAGVGAALALAFCAPFWIVSNRAHWAAFHVLLFLYTTRRFCHVALRYRAWDSTIFGILYGIGIVEYPTFVVFFPLFAGIFWAVLLKREQFEFRHWAPAVIGLLLGLSFYALAVWQFTGSAGYLLRGFTNGFDVLWALWRDQWFLLARSLPSQGWLVVLIMTVVPAATALMIATRALNGENDWTYYLLHLVLTGMSVAVLLNIRVAPWPMLNYHRLLVMPYVLNAALFGYLLAYWYMVPMPWRFSGASATIRSMIGLLVAAAGVALAATTAVLNVSQTDARASALIRVMASEIVRSLSGRNWLVSDGTMDGAILVEARRQGVPVHLLDLSSEQNGLMKQYVASQFSDPRMKNLAQLSLHTMVRAWFESDPAVLDQVAVLSTPDYWSAAGYQSVPSRTLFLGSLDKGKLDADALMKTNRAFWSEMLSVQAFRGGDVGPLDGYRRHIRQRVGMVANNLGVLMEDMGRKEDAYDCYTQARLLDASNISALMNQYTMVQQGYPAKDADLVRTALAEVGKSIAGKSRSLTGLMHTYGDVRAPTAFAHLGLEWALAGQPELAASGLRRAMGLAPEKGRGALKQTLANLYLMQRRDSESETLFDELLVENPNNTTALLGLARIEMERPNAAKAQDYLDRAAKAGVPPALINLEWAAYAIATDDNARAKEILKKAVQESPDLVRAWAMITAINIQERDALGLYDTIRHINRLKKGNELLLAIANGYLAIMQEDLSTATVELSKALALRPDDPQILEWLVRLDLLQGLTGRMEERLGQLLRISPKNAFGNFVMAGLQMQRKEFVLARDSLTRSIETQRTPEALNDLAWLLQESGLYQEAETNVRSALEMRPDLRPAWDTLGEILMKTDRLEEARAALEKAISLQANVVAVQLHMVELDLRQGRREDAAERLGAIKDRAASLSASESEELERLRKQL